MDCVPDVTDVTDVRKKEEGRRKKEEGLHKSLIDTETADARQINTDKRR